MTGPLVVVGDTLLDVDLVGRAGRLSPDAPVPVLDELAEWPRPGGAGLAALIAAREGFDVVLVTALGADDAGQRVERLLGAAGVELRRLPYDGDTPVKKRVRSGGQTVVRLDSGTRQGTVGAPSEAVEEALIAAAAVLVADYGRGVTSGGRLRALLRRATARCPVVWDPHPRGAEPVPGVTLVTPNEAEARELVRDPAVGGVERDGAPTPYLTRVGRRAEALATGWRAGAVAVTLGEGGALLSYGSGAPVVAPAPPVQCVDPCGAGDCFAVTAALCLGSGRVIAEAVEEAVIRAAGYVAAGGPATLTGQDRPVPTGAAPQGAAPSDHAGHDAVEAVRARGGTVVATGGCFDLLHAGHVASLRAARRLGDCLVVCLNSDASVRRLKGPSRPLVPAADRVRVLEALECVDAVVVFEEDTPVEVLGRLRPDVWAKGGDYAGADVPEAAVLREWGGQVVALPYLEGRSTSRLVQTAANRKSIRKESV